jgi:hypothetical protein
VITTAGTFRIVVFVSNVQPFYKQVTKQTRRGRGREERGREERGATPLTFCVG